MERLGTEVAMVPVDELQPDWDNKSDEAEEALAEQLADVPLAKLFRIKKIFLAMGSASASSGGQRTYYRLPSIVCFLLSKVSTVLP